ncbi:MAG TPA: hypothetical protein PK747_05710 [Acidobacteriota bacterium]|jgi:hypothetical protein|nr:hypothetical protein [Acidobacteriota bacterium]HNT17438.1 hypothetical protein [Acidobacteriota bacterium]HPA26206.1 hypothetical protein [Acidobacteriota bacterium]HQO18764.1 hypothetical protein [Acidobacteriota bacterium]HQQ46889.1 hypothetical protein [Acidobacteriota bacterium]
MKNSAFCLVCIFLFVPLFAGIGGDPAMQGRITSIEKKDQITTATVRMESSSITKDPSSKVKPGMSVRLIYSVGTAQFRPGIGRVLTIQENGNVLVAIDNSLLEKKIPVPNSNEPVTVSELFHVGAEVSISNEAL